MGKLIDPVIIRGTIMGRCPKCREPFMGELDADDQKVELKCVNCHHVGKYVYYWPDELPKVTLRHHKNRCVIGHAHYRRKQLANPDGVLEGQLSFPIGKGVKK